MWRRGNSGSWTDLKTAAADARDVRLEANSGAALERGAPCCGFTHSDCLSEIATVFAAKTGTVSPTLALASTAALPGAHVDSMACCEREYGEADDAGRDGSEPDDGGDGGREAVESFLATVTEDPVLLAASSSTRG